MPKIFLFVNNNNDDNNNSNNIISYIPTFRIKLAPSS